MEDSTRLPGPTGDSCPGCDNPCEGCLHWYSAYENNRCCNYIFDVGHRRPCPPGAKCTEYRKYRGLADRKLRKAFYNGYIW